jgi:hypothetical protein
MPCFDANTTVQTKEFATQLVDVLSCKLVQSQDEMVLLVGAAIVFWFIVFVIIIGAAILRRKRK